MFAFLEFFWSHRDGSAGLRRFREFENKLERLRSRHNREAVNRSFYKAFAGEQVTFLADLARRWFDETCLRDPRFFIPSSVERLRWHRQRGDLPVFLTGSAKFIVDPVVEHLGGGKVLAIDLECEHGRATGEISGIQTVGAGKLASLLRFAEEGGYDISIAHGYGDHPSDLAFLEAVGFPTVVAVSGEMMDIALDRKWPAIPA